MTRLNRLSAKLRVPPQIAYQRIWVGWELLEGKKVPFSRQGTRLVRARVNDPATWMPLDEAWALVEAGLAEGVGFRLDGSGVVAIDLDHCVRPGGELSPLAQQLVAELRSYTEWSPSLEGLHILVQGSLTSNYKGGGVELYASRRFITFTGRQLPGMPSDILPREARVQALHARLLAERQTHQTVPAVLTSRPLSLADGEVLRHARRACNRERFCLLYDLGRWGHHGSQSDAEFAMLRMLHFWTQDAAQLDRLYRASQLARPKWDAVHSGDGRTYGQLTLAKVLACGGAVYDPNWGVNR